MSVSFLVLGLVEHEGLIYMFDTSDFLRNNFRIGFGNVLHFEDIDGRWLVIDVC